MFNEKHVSRDQLFQETLLARPIWSANVNSRALVSSDPPWHLLSSLMIISDVISPAFTNYSQISGDRLTITHLNNITLPSLHPARTAVLFIGLLSVITLHWYIDGDMVHSNIICANSWNNLHL